MSTRLNQLLRKPIDMKNRKAVHPNKVSVFASNCNGACICHDLSLEFNSPFVNLWMTPSDFIKFLQTPKEYLTMPLEFMERGDVKYPVAKLGELTIWFEHYSSNCEAAEAWDRRCERICWNELYIMMTDRDGCTYEDLLAFDALPYEHKIVFTHCPYPEIHSAFYIPGFEDEQCVGICSEFKNWHTGKKWYDAFDYVAWFNGEKDYAQS